MEESSAPLLELKKASKRFPAVLANDRIDLAVGRGEVRALLGENGAGKSTLMSCLYGLFQMDSGEIFIEGQKVRIHNCNDAIRLGIGMVNQHFMLIQKLTVTENIILGMETKSRFFLDFNSAAKEIQELSDRYHFGVDPQARIENLSVGIQQKVEIIKILYRKSQIMIFDEPTAVLTPNEVIDFFEIIRKFRDEGRTIIFITHKLNEVMSICDSVTVLRDGRVVGSVSVEETSEPELAKMMVGREIELNEAAPARNACDPILTVKDLVVQNAMGINAVDGLSFTVCSGEILGIAGVDGNGQTELGQALTGLLPAASGSIEIDSVETTHFDPSRLLGQGVSHIPQDRHKTGLILDYSVEFNLVSKEIGQPAFSRFGVLRRDQIRNHAKKLIGDFNIRCGGPMTQAKKLSGGNQQKIIIAREFTRHPKLIVAIQPTRGLDISAIEFVWNELIAQRDRGAAILLISTELEEIFSLSDRIEVIFNGRFTGSIKGHDVDPLKIGLQMAGKTDHRPVPSGETS